MRFSLIHLIPLIHCFNRQEEHVNDLRMILNSLIHQQNELPDVYGRVSKGNDELKES